MMIRRPDLGSGKMQIIVIKSAGGVAGVLHVTQYYQGGPPIVSNNNIW